MHKFKYTIVLIFAFKVGFSQDYLIKKTGDSIKVKIVEIGLKEVKYKEYNNLSGITYGIYKSEVLRIRYQNGTIESFETAAAANTGLSQTQKCEFGRVDAERFHGNDGLYFTCGLACGPFALLATAITKQTPKMGLRTYKMSEHKDLFADPAYLACYNKKAKSEILKMEVQGWIVSIAIPIAIAYWALR